MSVREGIRRITKVQLYGLHEHELKTIAQKYGLKITEHTGDAWVYLEIPEAQTEIVWFKGHDKEA